MTKQQFAQKLWARLKQNGDVQSVIDEISAATINGKHLTITEQLEIVQLIRQINTEQTQGLFESVDGFLALVSTVEKTIKAQDSDSEDDTNGHK